MLQIHRNRYETNVTLAGRWQVSIFRTDEGAFFSRHEALGWATFGAFGWACCVGHVSNMDIPF